LHVLTWPLSQGNFVRIVISLLSGPISTQFEAAGCLIALSSAPTAVRAATQSYINLLCSQSDSNVKMIVLDRLVAIKDQHPKILQDLLLDVLRALGPYASSPAVRLSDNLTGPTWTSARRRWLWL
jgi:coatomer subunit beta